MRLPHGSATGQEPFAASSGKRMEVRENIEELGFMVKQLMTNIEADNQRLREQSESNVQTIRKLSTQLERLNPKVEVQ